LAYYCNNNAIEYEVINNLYYRTIDNKSNQNKLVVKHSKEHVGLKETKANNIVDYDSNGHLVSKKINPNTLREIEINNLYNSQKFESDINEKDNALDNMRNCTVPVNSLNATKLNLNNNQFHDKDTFKKKDELMPKTTKTTDIYRNIDFHAELESTAKTKNHSDIRRTSLNNLDQKEFNTANILNSAELEKSDKLNYFSFKSGLRDFLEEVCCGYDKKNERCLKKLKLMAVDLVAQELDLNTILTKLIQHEKLVENYLSTNENKFDDQNLVENNLVSKSFYKMSNRDTKNIERVLGGLTSCNERSLEYY
jgi:hypothetical protein